MVWKPLKPFVQSKNEVYIDLRDVHHVYRPGETVSGSVIVDVAKTITQSSTISVTFKGRLKLRGAKPQLRAQESVIFDDKVLLGETGTLTNGKHSFPFELELPQEDLLESIDFEMGNISYIIKGHLETAKMSKVSPPRSVKVATHRDVVGYARPKTVSLVVATSKRRKTKKITVKLSLNHKGWIHGEHIPIKLLIQHQWDVSSPAAIAVTLSRISRFIVGESEYTYRKDLDQSILGLYTDGTTKCAELTTKLVIPPDSLISASTPMIAFSYLIEVTIDLNGRIDFADWANSNPQVKMIDTDRVRDRPGVVSSWAEIVVGTHRSDSISNAASRMDSQSDVIQTAHATPPSSFDSSEHTSRGNVPSQSSSTSQTAPGPAAAESSAATEKLVLATRAQTLVPSVPEYPNPQEQPTAPSDSGIAAGPPYLNGGPGLGASEEKQAIRLRQLVSEPSPEYAPVYSPRATQPPMNLPSCAPSLSEILPSAPPIPPAIESTSAPPAPIITTGAAGLTESVVVDATDSHSNQSQLSVESPASWTSDQESK